jgi:hypothetical protein
LDDVACRFCFGHWNTRPVECRLLAALILRIPQGEDLGFISDFVLRILNLLDKINH